MENMVLVLGMVAMPCVVNLSGICMLPQWTIRTFAEFGVFGKFTGIRVESIAMVSSDHQVRCMGRGCHGIESREAW